jgi:myo-inositol 2-dehydrogenase/D-chiro-inositol 1-dehydrogenase
MTVRFAVVGCGPMGRIHARNIAAARDAELVAVADVEAELARAVAEESAPDRVYAHEQAVLDDGEIDAVVLATQPETHADLLAATARAGKHILCEKPVGVSIQETDSALRAVDAAGVKLMIGFNRRFDPTFGRIKSTIESGGVGQLCTLHIFSRDPAAGTTSPQGARDLFLDTSIHDFDLVRFMSGEEVESVQVSGRQFGEGRGDPDTAITVLTLPSGAVAVIDNSRLSAHGYDQRIEAFGLAGEASAPNVRTHSVTVSGPEGALCAPPMPFFTERYAVSYAAELEAFIDCLQNNSDPPVSGADGRAALVLAIAAQRSYREGRAVAVAELAG